VPYYEWKGYTAGAEKQIPNYVDYLAEQAGGPHVEERQQTPEDVMNRIAGIPKTQEEIDAEQEALEEERKTQAQKTGAIPTPPPAEANPTTSKKELEEERASRPSSTTKPTTTSS
jgi:hypothetical protein